MRTWLSLGRTEQEGAGKTILDLRMQLESAWEGLQPRCLQALVDGMPK